MKPLRYKYQTIEIGDNDIHLRTLKDKQQFSDQDNKAENIGISSATWSLFGVILIVLKDYIDKLFKIKN